jgi:hypothetical protein
MHLNTYFSSKILGFKQKISILAESPSNQNADHSPLQDNEIVDATVLNDLLWTRFDLKHLPSVTFTYADVHFFSNNSRHSPELVHYFV